MLTREEVAVAYGYTINKRGTIESPGKFEGEPWWVVALWELALDGGADDESIAWGDLSVSWFKVDDTIRSLIGISATYPASWVAVYENSVGFVCRRIFQADDAPETWGQEESADDASA